MSNFPEARNGAWQINNVSSVKNACIGSRGRFPPNVLETRKRGVCEPLGARTDESVNRTDAGWTRDPSSSISDEKVEEIEGSFVQTPTTSGSDQHLPSEHRVLPVQVGARPECDEAEKTQWHNNYYYY